MLIFDDDDDADADDDDDLEIDRIRPKQRTPNKTHINIYSSAFVFSNVYTRKISQDQPHCKNNVYNYIYYIMYKKNAY